MIGGDKKKYDYRKAEKPLTERCFFCWRFVPYYEIFDKSGTSKGFESRCPQMGMSNNITEKIRADHVCDLFHK